MYNTSKLIFLLFSYLAFMSCDLPPLPKPTLEETTNKATADAIREIINQSFDKAMKDIEKKFSKLAQKQIKTIKKEAQETIRQTAVETSEKIAKEIASKKVQTAIDDMEKLFSRLSESQIRVIKTATLEVASQIAENTAQNIAKDTTEQAIKNMEEEFSDLSQTQIQTIKTASLEKAGQISKDTAEHIAKKAIQKAIKDMEEEFSDLSQTQIQTIKTATLEIAGQISKDTAEHIAKKAIQKAIKNMEEEFSDLSQTQIEAIKTASLEKAGQISKDTAEHITKKAIQKAIKDMEEQFSNLSEEHITAIRHLTLETTKEIAKETAELNARNTAQETASQLTHQAIKDMKEEFSNLSQTQIEAIKTATLEKAGQISKDTAKHIAEKAIKNMEKQFSNLSEEQITAIRQLALETTKKIAKETAELNARNIAQETTSQLTHQAINDMEEEFSDLSQTQIEAIKKATLKKAEATAREVIDNILEDIVKTTVSSVTDSAIKDLEDKHSALLKAGLQNIMSAAIEFVAISMLPQSMDDSSKQETINTAIKQTVEVGKDIIFGEESNQNQLTRQSFSLAFEQCDWKNKDYTTEIIKNHSFFPFSDPLTSLIESWDKFKQDNKSQCKEFASLSSIGTESNNLNCIENNTIDKDFAYLHPLYNDFILSFFQESIKDENLSKNDIPLECFFAGAVKGANIHTSGSSFYYCNGDSNRPGKMTVIDDNEKTRTISAQRACLNRDYVFLTAKAFNKTADCFGFDKSEKEVLFKLFNHESSFLHNVKSPTGARCYGQLTGIAIEEINKQIYFSNSKNPLAYSFIFDEVMEECPGLQKAVLAHEIYQDQRKKSLKKFHSMISNLPTTCKVTQNPYSCFFYAFYNFKINTVKINKDLQKPTTPFLKNNKLPKNFKNTFSLPILLNEMRGVTNAKGRDMIFWDDSELWSSLREEPLERLQNIRQLPLFENEKEVKNLFNLWAYNGGISISDYMKSFINQLKYAITNPCPPHSNSKFCQYRFTVQEGRGIATEDIKKDFKSYISKNYKPQETNKRRAEVKSFTENVEKSLNYLYNKNGLFRIHLKNLVPKIENHDVANFQDHLKDVCPK